MIEARPFTVSPLAPKPLPTALRTVALLLRLSRRFELGFGRSLRLCLQFSLGLANALSALLLVDDPIRHLLASLIGAVPLILLGIGRLGRRKPFAYLGLQLG